MDAAHAHVGPPDDGHTGTQENHPTMNVPASAIASAQNILASGGLAQRLSLLTTTPIQPPDGALGGRTIAPKSPTAAGGNSGDISFSKLKLASVADRVAFIRLKDDPLFPGTMSFDVRYATDLPTVGQRAGWVPVWFLPWKSERLVKIKIESHTKTAKTDAAFAPGGGIAPLPNPDIFFTAAINGCSVFAMGDTRAPSLYHGGVEGAMEGKIDPVAYTNLGGSSEAVWQSLVEGGIYDANGPLRPRAARGAAAKANKPNFSEVNRAHYVAERDSTGAQLRARGGGLTTAPALEIEKALRGKSGLTEVNVSPWGCVFGLRDSTGHWSCYLVRNAMVSYKRMHWRRGSGWRLLTRETDQWATSQVINLGFQQFFPGMGAAHYRAIRTSSLY